MVLEVEVLRLIEVADSEPGTGFGFAVEIQQRPLEPALGLGPELVGLEQLEPEHEPAVAVVAVVVAAAAVGASPATAVAVAAAELLPVDSAHSFPLPSAVGQKPATPACSG